MRFTIHTGRKLTPFELHHGRKSRTELTNIVKDGKSYLSDLSELSVSAPNKPKIPIYVGRDADGDRGKTTSPTDRSHRKRKIRLDTLFNLLKKNYNKKSLEGKFQNKIETAISGTESTIKTDTGKIINRKSISDPLFQTGRKIRKEPALHTTGEINPKNRHCIRGLDGKYSRWDEILKDTLNGKMKIVPNKKRAESDTEEDDDDEDEEMPEEAGSPVVYDTSEKDGRYVPKRTNPEKEDTLQLHTDSEITGEKLKTQIRRTNRESKIPNRYGSITYTGNFLGIENKCLI